MGASIASALLPLINIEAILVVSVSQAPGQMWALVVAATVGQMLGKILWYWGGMHARARPVGPPPAREAQGAGRRWTSGTSAPRAGPGSRPACSSSPPAPASRRTPSRPCSPGRCGCRSGSSWLTGLAGRGLRFWAVVTGTSSLVHLF